MNKDNEFLRDPEFIRWVRFPEKKLDLYWKNWMEANPERTRDIKLAREIISGFHFPERKPEAGLKQEVLNQILSDTNKTKDKRKSDSGRRNVKTIVLWERFNQFQRIAAIILFTLALSALYNGVQYEEPITPEYVAVNMLSKSAVYGEKLNFRLPDGTTVWMNSGSKIEYPETFDSTVRLVRLYGEAFFDVKPDVSQPFKVISENLVTTALGTSFNIDSSDEKDLRIALVTGKVSIENRLTDEEFMLKPGQRLDYQLDSKSTSVVVFSEKDVLAWKEGVLVFQNASFTGVIRELERWYGVEIKVAGKPLRPWSFSGSFPNQNLDIVLTSMSYIEDFRFELIDKKVKIKF